MTKKPKILVIGSLAMDLVVTSNQLPQSGETVIGTSFRTAPGGKGANQAVQAARLGADVTMVGKVGCDSFGDQLLASLKEAGVNIQHIEQTKEAPSTISNIWLEQQNEGSLNNRIITVPGANRTLRSENIAFLQDSIVDYDMVLLQLEIPMAVNEMVTVMAAAEGVPVMLNPAPFTQLSKRFLQNVTYLSPNETEAAALLGVTMQRGEAGISQESLQQAAISAKKQGYRCLILTLGDNGAELIENGRRIHCPAVSGVRVVDPTGAGDSFVAAFSIGRCLGLTNLQAVAFANQTAAITVASFGAQPSLPRLQEVLQAMRSNRFDRFDLKMLDALSG